MTKHRSVLQAAILALAAWELGLPVNGSAQERESAADTTAAVDSVASTEDAAPSRGNTFVPLPVIFYQPETGLGFGATAIYFFQLSPAAEPADTARRFPSSVSAVAVYAVKKQIITILSTELYPAGGRYRLFGQIGYIKFPAKFWGIGNDTPDFAEEDYTPETIGMTADLQREIFPGWFAGVLGQFAYRALSEVEPGGLIAEGSVPGTEDGRIVGVGFSVSRDTRKSRVYPRASSFHTFRAALYDGFFGSDYDYASFSLDLRKYQSLLTTHVLALRALGVVTPGDPPFDFMPQLGGDMLLRGYFAGRFRDRDLLTFQAEYRAPVWWRIGAVAFVAAGQVAHDVNDFRLDAFHPSAGFGLRFQLSETEEFNIRADFAWGFDVESTGFYLNLGEAF